MKKKDQYYTQADMETLRNAGYDKPFMNHEEGASDYVCNYLHRDFQVY